MTPRVSAIVLLVWIGGWVAHGSVTVKQQGVADSKTNEAAAVFTSIALSAGIDFQHTNGASPEKFLAETMGSGGLFFDYNNDGFVDVFLVDGGSLASRELARKARHRLYRNRGDGTFADVTATSGIGHGAYGMGACAADYDNDGWIDLYVTGVGTDSLYHNNGNGAFSDVTRRAGIGSTLWSTSCAFADFDKDGFVDLFVTNYVDASVEHNPFCGDAGRKLRVYCHPLNFSGLPSILYHNNGDGTFSDRSAQAGIGRYRGNGLGVVVADYNDDGWPDVFVANDSVPNFLYRNQGNGTFAEAALLAGVAVATDGKPRAGMGTDFGDYDGDGRLDLVVTNHEFETHSLFRNLGRGLSADATAASGIGPPTLAFVGFGAVFFDYDNDGRLDLAIVNGHVVDNTALVRPGSSHAQRRLLFHNEGNGRFSEVGRASGSGFAADRVGRTLVFGDIDNDGDLDLLVTNNGQTADLLRNDGGETRNALLVGLVGRQSNRNGIGARLRLSVGGKFQVREVKAGSSYLGQNDIRAHFGLGAASEADSLEVVWPSGRRDLVRRVGANQILTVTEGEGVTRRRAFAKRRPAR